MVDDGSTFPSERFQQITSKYDAKYLRNSTNEGPGVARNLGAEVAMGGILVFIDSDCVAPADWLTKLIKPIAGAVHPVTTSCYSSPVHSTWLTEFQNEDYLYRMPSVECDLYFVNSCNFAIERRLFFECGGFPPKRISEDMVLGMILASRGTPARYLPDATIQHDYHMSLTGYLKQRATFASYMVKSYLKGEQSKYRKLNSEARSFNPLRTTTAIFLSSVALSSFILASVAVVVESKYSALFATVGLISLVLETGVHGRFLRYLTRRQGLARALTYIFLLLAIDIAYLSGGLMGLVQGFEGMRRMVAPPAEVHEAGE